MYVAFFPLSIMHPSLEQRLTLLVSKQICYFVFSKSIFRFTTFGLGSRKEACCVQRICTKACPENNCNFRLIFLYFFFLSLCLCNNLFDSSVSLSAYFFIPFLCRSSLRSYLFFIFLHIFSACYFSICLRTYFMLDNVCE